MKTLTPAEKRAMGRELYQERQKNAGAPWWISERPAFLRRVRALARQINPQVTQAESEDEVFAMMYVDNIATREDVEIKFEGEA